MRPAGKSRVLTNSAVDAMNRSCSAAPIAASERDRFLASTAQLVNMLDLPAGPVLVAR